LEAKKPYYSKYLELCSDASAAAGTIATTKDPKKKQVATADFWRLYWGPMGLVERGGVTGAMVAFGKTCPTARRIQSKFVRTELKNKNEKPGLLRARV
jgi:hypothetical protein